MIKDIIRLKWEAERSHEQIAAALGVSEGVVAKYVGLAAAAGLDWQTVREWDERQLVFRLVPRAARPSTGHANIAMRTNTAGTVTNDRSSAVALVTVKASIASLNYIERRSIYGQ